MYNVLIKLIVVASLLELGISLSSFDKCSTPACWNRIQQASHKVLKIDWKPISVFPDEARRFHQSSK